MWLLAHFLHGPATSSVAWSLLTLSLSHSLHICAWLLLGAKVSTMPGSQRQMSRVLPTQPHRDHSEYLRPVFRADLLKYASANQPRVSVVLQGLEPLYSLLQGLKSCKHHSNRRDHPPASTITINKGSETGVSP